MDLTEYSDCHRTTLEHFLAEAKWDEAVLQNKVEDESLRQVVDIANRASELLFVIHDDTISKKIRPSSQAKTPMEQTDFHHSHMEVKVVWGHQVQAAVVQSSNTSLIHSIDLYDKTRMNPNGTVYTKIDRICDMAATLPVPPYVGYALIILGLLAPA